MKRILFLYGYNSGLDSGTFAVLKRILENEELAMDIIEYDQNNPQQGVFDIDAYIEEHHIAGVIGHSLGGFFALCLRADIPRLVINPCLYPRIELEKLGASNELSARYAELERYLEDGGPLRRLDDVFGLFGDNDELFDYYDEFVSIYGQCAMRIKSCHRPTLESFTEDVIDKIRAVL